MLEVAVVGASGYGGGELIRLLRRHPHAKVRCAISETYAGKPVTAAWLNLLGVSDLVFQSYNNGLEAAQCDVVFLAMENGKAAETAPHLLEAGCKVIDLSADFRFRNLEVYTAWYKIAHPAPQWNDRAVYGLTEIFGDEIRKAKLVGNPGCYPTAATLALAPLVKNRLIQLNSIIVDAKSGVSGAGRSKFGLEYHYPEVNENVSAYKVAGTHRHTPEIETNLIRLAEESFSLTFTPHLIPMTRGILATCYATPTKGLSTENLTQLYIDFYATHPFVIVMPEELPATKQTLGSNRCHIAVRVDERTGRIVVLSAIDNLVKGAAGQAIQNMNVMCGFEETSGLLDEGGIWP